jgi:serine/threonine protein kinase
MKTDTSLEVTTGRRASERCPSCGTPYPAGDASGGCPVCQLRRLLSPEAASDDEALFDHYELAWTKEGAFEELGHGAMGITYKAFDTVLSQFVALKVMDARIASQPKARERFLREAQAAAQLRHPNVASVFYYGVRKRDGQCFYAMELVEGETLEARLRRVGALSPTLALEAVVQVSRALAAAEAQGLVHRDLKPSNLMLTDRGEFTVKVIDFGLAKTSAFTDESSGVSRPGFLGTPAFASPEQCAGIEVDIRSDLYALGVILWEMVTGHVMFRGSAAEVMHQQQHEALPLEQLEGVPQPIVLLLEMLLAKDPGQRFQSPVEVLKVTPMIADAVEAEQTITYQSLRKLLAGESYAATRKSPARQQPEKISIARLPITGSDIFGREEDIAFLNDAWANPNVNVVTIVAWAGVGKSTLVNHWLRRMAVEHYRSAEIVFGWSFYRQGSSRGTSSAHEFLDASLTWFGDPKPQIGTQWEKGERLAKLVAGRRTLLILDGLEPLQNPPGPDEARLRDSALQALLREIAVFNTGLCVITSRLPIADIAQYEETSAPRRDLEQLSSNAGAKLLRALGVRGSEDELRSASDEFSGHGLALKLLGSYLTDAFAGDIRCRAEVSCGLAHDVRQGAHARRVLKSYQAWFDQGPELSVLRILGLFDRPADEHTLAALLKPPAVPNLTDQLTHLSATKWRTILTRLRSAGLLAGKDPNNRVLDAHPLVREYFGEQLRTQQREAWIECNRRLYDHYQGLAPPLPDNVREMEPLFLAVICGCNAGLFHRALHEVYISADSTGKCLLCRQYPRS